MRNWSDVSATLLLTLYARALESQSGNPVLRDPKAEEIVAVLDRELAGSPAPMHGILVRGRLPRKLPVAMALRARYFDRAASDWLAAHPGGPVGEGAKGRHRQDL